MQLWVNGNEYSRQTITGGQVGGAMFTRALVVGTDCQHPSLLPVRGWVDELRLYALQDDALTGTHEVDEDFFHEWVCNRAYGSLAAGAGGNICEQIEFGDGDDAVPDSSWTYSQCSSHPIGTGLDFDIDAYADNHCGTQVHRNADPSCVRATEMGLPTLS